MYAIFLIKSSNISAQNWNFLLLGEKIDRYMAPEVFKHRRYDKKVDVFSFAMILYEVIRHT